jgi:CubicO group peptidase (beta-lactamase class C family)
LKHPDYSALAGPLEQTITQEMAAWGIAGIAVALVDGQQTVYAAGFGQARRDSVFRCGSISKLFNALAVMQLVEAGKIDLDTPVQHYIPWFRVADSAVASAITVRQLLNQTSGIPTSAGIRSLYGPDKSLADQVRQLAKVSLATTPGTAWAYSNVNYDTLGLLVEQVSGQAYGQYVEEHIFGPLGMTHSHSSPQDASSDGLAAGHQYWFAMAQVETPEFRADSLPAGFLISTAEDLSHYLAAMLNGGIYGGTSILSPAGIEELQRPAVKVSPQSSDFYAMGWYRSTTSAGVPVIGHDGETHDMSSMLLMVPVGKWGIALLFNSGSWLYSALGRYDAIAFNVAGMLGGQAPASSSLPRPYLFADLVALLLPAFELRSLIRFVRSKKPIQPDATGSRVAAGWHLLTTWVWPIAREFVIPVLVLVLAPVTSNAPWSALLRTDLGVWIVAYSFLLIVAGGIRMSTTLRRSRLEVSRVKSMSAA